MELRNEISFEKYMPYHVLSRTIEGREVFVREEDCLRFVFQMYAANVGKPAPNLYRRDVIKAARGLLSNEPIDEKFIIIEHAPLVSFLSFTLVGNHYHFLLTPNIEKGIAKFMQRLNNGYAKYFNLKYNRIGNLFSKPYKIIPIKTNLQLDAIICYINVINPLDVYQLGWRERGLSNREESFKFLNRYQFSSLLDLFGERHSKILAPPQILKEFLGEEMTQDHEEYLNFIKNFIGKRTQPYHHLFLE